MFFIKLIIWLFFILIKSKHYQNLILQIAKALDIILGRWLLKLSLYGGNMETYSKKLNSNYVYLTNRCGYSKEEDFPMVGVELPNDIDYLALYTNKKDYMKTDNTAVCFYQYDNKFDNFYGLFNAIFYNNTRLLNKFKNRFKDVKYMIEPDYSQCGDAAECINKYNVFRQRIVNVWLTFECNILVIPNINYIEINKDFVFEGIKEGSTIAMSVMGMLRAKQNTDILLEGIRKAVDTIHPNKIIVYTASNKDRTMSLFKYATKSGVKVLIPDNKLLERNSLKQNGGINIYD